MVIAVARGGCRGVSGGRDGRRGGHEVVVIVAARGGHGVVVIVGAHGGCLQYDACGGGGDAYHGALVLVASPELQCGCGLVSKALLRHGHIFGRSAQRHFEIPELSSRARLQRSSQASRPPNLSFLLGPEAVAEQLVSTSAPPSQRQNL